MAKEPSKIKILIADDSVVYRSQIRSALGGIPRVDFVGASPSGKLTLERLSQTTVDLVILDLEMPDMSGMETLRAIRKAGHSCKVLVFSSSTEKSAQTTLEALQCGATDFINKPDSSAPSVGGDPSVRIRELLDPKIQSLFPEVPPDLDAFAKLPSNPIFPKIHWEIFKPKIIVIGSSTGGPGVLEKILVDLPAPLDCPIVIAQHMPPVFTATFASRLSSISGIPAREAEHGKLLEKNTISVAPGDFHLRLTGTPDQTRMMLDQGPKIHSVRPAVDHLFQSASEIFKDRCLGFVLTGMGYDGRAGAIAIKKSGGAIVIQNERSCVVFGMPGAVHEAGAFDRIASPSEIAQIIKEKAVHHVPSANRKPETGRI
jgi:two-component system chemotaxis response regulator CheB